MLSSWLNWWSLAIHNSDSDLSGDFLELAAWIEAAAVSSLLAFTGVIQAIFINLIETCETSQIEYS